ncbi:MAG: HlyD family type I secretion periplasmic adaptor subunit [Pseudomonadota bacterium]
MRNQISISKEAAAEVVSHDVTTLSVNTDARIYARMGWLIVLLGVGGFLLWAMLAPLDKGVPLSGTVAKETSRKTVQHPTGGIVKSILVHDGDTVKAGQVLVQMNNVMAGAQVETTRAQYITARAAEARLQAERDGLAKLTFPPTLQAYKNDPRVTAAVALQQQLFESRRGALQSELAGMDENVAGMKLQIQGLENVRDSLKAQKAILDEQLVGMRDLAKDGYVARNRLLDLERTAAQTTGALAENLGSLGRSQRQVMETALRRSQRMQEFQKDVRSQLGDTQREAEALASRIEGQDFELANTDVKAPADGTVVGLSIFTNGGVVAPGAHMMDIVPSADALVVEGQLAVNLIDKVHVGLPVEMMFAAFNTNKTPHIPGIVTQVSADRTVDERTGQPYYKIRAKVSPEGARLIALKKLDVQSGMPVEMFIKTGERTMMNYLLKPLFDRAKSSMAED